MITDTPVKLKNYVFFREVEDGVLFEAGKKTFVLRGKGIYPVVARVIRLLDKGATFADIGEQVPEKLTPFVQRLLAELASHEMLLNASAELDLANRYEGQAHLVEFIHFLQDQLGDAYAAAFERWQSAEIVVLGNGYALKSALSGVLNSGVGALTLWLAGQGHPQPAQAELETLIAERQQHDNRFRYKRLTRESLINEIQTTPGRLTLVCADDWQGLLRELGEDLVTLLRDTPYMVASATGAFGFISPLNEAGYTSFADLREWRPAQSAADDVQLSPAGFSLVGALAAFNFLKHAFAIDSVFLRNHCALVSPYLDVDYHPLLPVTTLARSATLLPVEYHVPFEIPEGRPVSHYETVLVKLAPLFDRQLGAFSDAPAKTLRQLPLYHDAIEVRFPRAVGVAPQRVYSWGTSAEDAGTRALARALALYTRVHNQHGSALAEGAVVAAFDRQSWLRKAAALAVINAADFPATANRAYVNAENVSHTDIQMLVRVLRLYHNGFLNVELFWREGISAFAARLQAESGQQGLGYGATPAEAVLECLGEMCSQYQFPEFTQGTDIEAVKYFPSAELPLCSSVWRDYAEPMLPAVVEQLLPPIFHTDAYWVGSVSMEGVQP